MKRRSRKISFSAVVKTLAAVVLLIWFLGSITGLSRGYDAEDQQRLEEAIRRAAVSCYATEGFYPPSLAYMEQHYGIQIDSRRFAVSYIPIAENLMPNITVLEK